jgi:hypothetical protein
MLLKINMKTEIKKRGGISVPRAPVVGLCYINTMYVKWEWNWELNDQCICTRTNLYLKGQSLTCYVIDKFMWHSMFTTEWNSIFCLQFILI